MLGYDYYPKPGCISLGGLASALLHRVAGVGAQTLLDSAATAAPISIFMMPDRHFFEVLPKS